MIINFLRSPRWKAPIMSFLDENCLIFDNEDENKLEYTVMHNVIYQSFLLCKIEIQEDNRGATRRVNG